MAEEAKPFVRTKFPLLAADAGEGLLVLGGGGGSSKTGVPNSLMLCSLASGGIVERALHPTGDEAATSLSVDASGRHVACCLSNSIVVSSSVRVPLRVPLRARSRAAKAHCSCLAGVHHARGHVG